MGSARENIGDDVIEEFEKKYKDIFSWTADMFEQYTELCMDMDLEFNRFVYEHSEISHRGSKYFSNFSIETEVERNEKKCVIDTKVGLFPGQYEKQLLDLGFLMMGAHEASEVMYFIARDLTKRRAYRYAGEIIGDFFLREACKKYGVDADKLPYKFVGIYDIASGYVDRLEELPEEEQVEAIKNIVFAEDTFRFRAIDYLAKVLHRFETRFPKSE